MKTITEFPALNLKQAEKTRQELVAAGKTPEELPAALGEALKVEGDRLKRLMDALDALGGKVQDLKRIVVFALAEGEKAPQGAVQKEDLHYVVEYYPPLAKNEGRHARGGKGRGDRDGKRGGKRGGRGGRGGERPEHARRDAAGAGRPEGGGEKSGERRPGRRRPPRGPRPEGAGGDRSMKAAPNPKTGKTPKVIIVRPSASAPAIKPVEKAEGGAEAPVESGTTSTTE